jgi:hypothetical protein
MLLAAEVVLAVQVVLEVQLAQSVWAAQEIPVAMAAQPELFLLVVLLDIMTAQLRIVVTPKEM